MNLIIATHTHRHGCDIHLFKTPLRPEEFPSIQAVAEILDIDFESHRPGCSLTDETLEFMCIDANYQIDEFDHRWRQVHPEPVDYIEAAEDHNSPEALKAKYDQSPRPGAGEGSWGEHPEWPMSEWQLEAGEGNTRLGYWEWVSHQLESMEDEK